MTDLKHILQQHIEQAHEMLELMMTDRRLQESLIAAADECVKAIGQGRKILICGNGGSATHAQHLAAELIGRFKKEREAYAAISLTADSSILTAIGNDYGYNCVFSRQVAGLGQRGDILISLSTSGRSVNVINAMATAGQHELINIAITGKSAGQMGELADIAISVPAMETDRIQEAHMLIVHMLTDLIEKQLYALRNGRSIPRRVA